MKYYKVLTSAVFWMLSNVVLIQTASANPPDTGNIVVLADETSALPMMELARRYSQQRKATINLTFGSNDAQVAQIFKGRACDLFIGTQIRHFARLRAEGVIDIYSQRTIARNGLVLVGPKNHQLQSAPDETAALLKKVMTDSNNGSFLVPDLLNLAGGIEAMEALHRLEVGNGLEASIERATSFRALFDAVRRQKRFALVPASEALRASQGNAAVTVAVLPPEIDRPVRYEAAVVGGENMVAARKFLDYLTTNEARDVFRKYGFSD